MDTIKTIIKKYWLYPAGAIVGGAAGYWYWLNWTCDTGCPLTATPIRTVIYGALMGVLLFSLFIKKQNIENE